jgi:hypothetical protein
MRNKEKKERNERFKKVYSEGGISSVTIIVDKETGVNYLYCQSGYAGGLTVLLGEDGKPVITPKELI